MGDAKEHVAARQLGVRLVFWLKGRVFVLGRKTCVHRNNHSFHFIVAAVINFARLGRAEDVLPRVVTVRFHDNGLRLEHLVRRGLEGTLGLTLLVARLTVNILVADLFLFFNGAQG